MSRNMNVGTNPKMVSEQPSKVMASKSGRRGGGPLSGRELCRPFRESDPPVLLLGWWVDGGVEALLGGHNFRGWGHVSRDLSG